MALKNKIWLAFFLTTTLILTMVLGSISLLFHKEWIQDEKDEIYEDFQDISQQSVFQFPLDYQNNLDYYLSAPDQKYFSPMAEKLSFPDFTKIFQQIDTEWFLILPFQSEKWGTLFIGENVSKHIQSEKKLLSISIKISALSLLFLIFISWLFSRIVILPIRIFQKDLEQITPENLEWKGLKTFSSSDEFEQLQKSFYEMLQKVSLFQKQQKDFIRHAAHELRTPLMAVSSALDLAQKYPDKLNEAREDLLFLSKLVERLLMIASLDKQIETTDVFLRTILEKQVKKFYKHSQEKNISLSIKGGDIHIQSEEILLTRVIDNILENALKFTPYGGSIVLYVHNHELEIHNTYDGDISVENLSEAFHQGDSSHQQEGVGLGLYFVRKALKHLGHGLKILKKDKMFIVRITL